MSDIKLPDDKTVVAMQSLEISSLRQQVKELEGENKTLKDHEDVIMFYEEKIKLRYTERIAELETEDERSKVLLRASYDMINSVEQAQYTIVKYDNADCDGVCLLNDIEMHMGVYPEGFNEGK